MRILRVKRTYFKTINLVIFSTFCITSFGQIPKPKRDVGNGIYILPTQLFSPELIITYERFYNQNHSYSYSIGYKVPNEKGNTVEPFGHGLFAIYEYQYMFNEFANAIYTSFAPSHYFGKYNKYYFQSELFYRYYWFNDKRMDFDNFEDIGFNAIRSESSHILGLKILLGANHTIRLNEFKAINIKIYGGVGFRYKNYKYENIDNVYSDNMGHTLIVPFQSIKGDLFVPSIQLGIKIGVAKITELGD
jgi:hypothetical protein